MYNQPRSIQERLNVANEFVREFAIDAEPLLHMVVDDLSADPQGCDPADRAYAFWPTRFYVVDSGEVSFKAHPNKTHEYKLEDLAHFLERAVA
eukprot:COSAG01_NODE_6021_length_3898_cov_35.243485_5_plen_93_part_00